MIIRNALRQVLVSGRPPCYRYASTSSHRSDVDFTIVEVGPRDGLQNEKEMVSTEHKVELINRLSLTGLPVVEATSFVSPKWVPQMGDHKQIMELITREPRCRYPVLVPNVQGLKAALKSSVSDIAVFTAASESFSRLNTNCSIEEGLERFEAVCNEALVHNLNIRGYVSCVLGCPYEGKIKSSAVIQVGKVCKRLLAMGCSELSLGDTIGIGTAGAMKQLLVDINKAGIPNDVLAVHCHDTYGQALANCLMAFEHGIRTADSSVAGLGGCPYAKGASGNLATEDLVYMLHGLGAKTGVNLNELVDVGVWISTLLNRQPQSKVTMAKMSTKEL